VKKKLYTKAWNLQVKQDFEGNVLPITAMSVLLHRQLKAKLISSSNIFKRQTPQT